MSVSTAFQSLRLPARSLASRHSTQRSGAFPGSATTSSSVDRAQSSRSVKHIRLAVAPSHAPHGHLDKGAAGPSRCFCTSHRPGKASELPLEELHYDASLDSYHHSQLPTTNHYWRPSDTSPSPLRSLDPPTYAQQPSQHTTQNSQPPRSIRSLHDCGPDDPRQTGPDSTCNGFFTPSVRQNTRHEAVSHDSIAKSTPAGPVPSTCTSFIESLDRSERKAFDDRMRMLIRSGERSIPALSAEYPGLTPEQSEQICCHIMSQCIDDNQDAHILWDLYRTWAPSPSAAVLLPSGPTRRMLQRMQGTALYRCCMYLQARGLIRQAAIVAGDARLKPSQSRYLLERLVFDLKLPASLSANQNPLNFSDANAYLASTTRPNIEPVTVADARFAVREISDTMMNLMADGTAFKRKTLNRTFKLLCLTRARSWVVQFLRAAQRRAEIDSSIQFDGGHCGVFRAAGGFSRFRSEEVTMPQVISTKVMEDALRVLCAQGSAGARTAYEVLCALNTSQRSLAMYDALMTVYGDFEITAGTAAQLENSSHGCGSNTDLRSCSGSERRTGFAKVDDQLWTEICTLPHLGGPTPHTMSARIVCHARARKLELIRLDLAFLRSSHLGTIHDLTEKAKLSIVRCCVESGSLLTAFRYTSVLLIPAIVSHNAAFQSRLVHTLLLAAQHMRISARHSTRASSSSTPSKAQLLKRFLRHFSHLHRRFPELQPGVETLKLLIQLLDRHQQWIATETLWSMLRVVGKHFGREDPRLLSVLHAFINVFETRGETHSAAKLKALVETLEQQIDKKEGTSRDTRTRSM